MLVKLNRNKFLLISLFLVASCNVGKSNFGVYHTELLCPNFEVILIRYTRLAEVKKAIQKAYDLKQKFRTSEAYTVISFDGNRSMRIDKLLPEDAIKCDLREIYSPTYDRYKSQYTDSPGFTPW